MLITHKLLALDYRPWMKGPSWIIHAWQIGDTFFKSHRLFRSKNALWRELKKIDMCWLIDTRLENTFSMLPQTMGRLSAKTTVFWRQDEPGARGFVWLGVVHSSRWRSSPSLSSALIFAPQMLRAEDWPSVSPVPWVTDCDSSPVSLTGPWEA